MPKSYSLSLRIVRLLPIDPPPFLYDAQIVDVYTGMCRGVYLVKVWRRVYGENTGYRYAALTKLLTICA